MDIELIRQVDRLQAQFDGLVKPELPPGLSLRALFSAYNSANDLNVTGDGTIYTIICDTELVDRNGNYNNATGVFTASVTGWYAFVMSAYLFGILNTHTQCYYRLATTAANWYVNYNHPYNSAWGTSDLQKTMTIFVPLTATDTAYFQVLVAGGAKVVDVLGTGRYTYFEGYLLI